MSSAGKWAGPCRAAVALALLAVWSNQAAGQTTPTRIVTFGTSLTSSGGWQGELQKRLRRCLTRDLVVLNEGEAGKGSTWGLAHVGRAIAAAPDIAVIEFAINDAVLHPAIGADLDRSRAQTRSIVEAIRSANPSAKIFLLITNPVRGSQGESRPKLDAFYETYRELAREGVASVVDTSAAWARAADRDVPDGLHPTRAAHLAITVPALVGAIAPLCRTDPLTN